MKDSRIFQNLSVVQIIDAAIGAYLTEYSREIRVEVENEDNYLRREYCVQYQESALDFLHRLLEDEGLTYYFDQSGDREVLVVVDDNSAFPRAPLMPEATAVPFVAGVTGSTVVREEPLRELTAHERLGPTSLTIADFDWTADRLPFSSEQRTTDHQERGREEYIHDRATVITEYDRDARRYQSFDYRQRVDRGRERQAMQTHDLVGRSEVVGLSAGSVIEVTGHPNDLDGEYLVVEATTIGHDHDLGDETSRAVRDRPEHENTFRCIPLNTQFRPPQRAAKPRIHGIQSARVVGPSDEEIWVDEHGRVRIQFHWDRRGPNDETSTCWVRVMQSWAGPGFGAVFIPRIGMEVVVSFLDGDPDRPLVTGCVYNGVNFPSLTLPEAKTQSTIRTQSSPADEGGFNELRFEDKAGEEHVCLHAQRDHLEEVGNDQTITVGGNQRETVDRNVTSHIKGSQQVTIDGEEQGDDHEVTGASLTINGKYKIHTEDDIDISAAPGKHIRLRVGDSYIEITEDTITIHSGGSSRAVLDDSVEIQSSQGSLMRLNEAAKMRANGAGEVYLDENAMMRDASGSEVHLDSSKARLLASPGAELKLTADAELTGTNAVVTGTAKATLKSDSEAVLAVNASQTKASPSGVNIAGTTVTAKADSMLTLEGAMVSIN